MFPFKSIPNSVADGDVCSALLFFVFFFITGANRYDVPQ